MRFLHLADLHIGKAIHGVSLLDNGDQTYWKEQFLERARKLRPDAVVIAGDVYDRSAPSGEEVRFLSDFLTELIGIGVPVMMTAGNHDSAQRLSFARELLANQGLHISAMLSESPELTHITLNDAYGPVTFWLMPYAYPALVAHALQSDGLRDYDSAVRALLSAQSVDFSQRNVLVAHQNVTCNGREAPRGGSESMVGGVGQVDYTAFDGFDYVALGHIHSGYAVGRESVRYAGSPLCYHFEETKLQNKGAVLVELGEKGAAPRMETISIPPLHPMRELRGPYEEIRRDELAQRRTGEYIRIVLTDRRVTPEISGFFRDLYHGRDSALMELVSEYHPYQDAESASAARGAEQKPIETLFADFYESRFGEPPTERDFALFAFAAELTRHRERGASNDKAIPDDKAIGGLLDYLMRQEEAADRAMPAMPGKRADKIY